jgi:hypothetical protein
MATKWMVPTLVDHGVLKDFLPGNLSDLASWRKGLRTLNGESCDLPLHHSDASWLAALHKHQAAYGLIGALEAKYYKVAIEAFDHIIYDDPKPSTKKMPRPSLGTKKEITESQQLINRTLGNRILPIEELRNFCGFFGGDSGL